MTVDEALAEGRLTEAIALQEAVVAAAPDDPAARRLLVELLLMACRCDNAVAHLAAIRDDAPDWPETERGLYRLIRSERRRSLEGRRPRFRPEPVPEHVVRRWRAVVATRRANPTAALRHLDAADAASPVVAGFLDGHEFEGLRDADDRFASVLEVFVGGEYFWYAWEGLRKVRLTPAVTPLDHLYRPATLTLRDGSVVVGHVPLVYPGSAAAGDAFALGRAIDFVCPDGGLTRCIGGKLLLVGEDDECEVPLAECHLIELGRPAHALATVG